MAEHIPDASDDFKTKKKKGRAAPKEKTKNDVRKNNLKTPKGGILKPKQKKSKKVKPISNYFSVQPNFLKRKHKNDKSKPKQKDQIMKHFDYMKYIYSKPMWMEIVEENMIPAMKEIEQTMIEEMKTNQTEVKNSRNTKKKQSGDWIDIKEASRIILNNLSMSSSLNDSDSGDIVEKFNLYKCPQLQKNSNYMLRDVMDMVGQKSIEESNKICRWQNRTIITTVDGAQQILSKHGVKGGYAIIDEIRDNMEEFQRRKITRKPKETKP